LWPVAAAAAALFRVRAFTWALFAMLDLTLHHFMDFRHLLVALFLQNCSTYIIS